MPTATPTATPTAQPCADGSDNDGDGFLDLDDPGCDDPSDPSEQSAALPCDDGVDNEIGPFGTDGLVDWPADPGCRHLQWWTEEPRCQDGIDNDARPGIDFDGGASAGLSPPDVADPQCDAAWKTREVRPKICGLGFELAWLLPPLLWLSRRRRQSRPGV